MSVFSQGPFEFVGIIGIVLSIQALKYQLPVLQSQLISTAKEVKTKTISNSTLGLVRSALSFMCLCMANGVVYFITKVMSDWLGTSDLPLLFVC